ncbi:lysozyme C-1-like [Ascaphus truei]|uniref:lysozyme C-1-like n=1 Tax=Ascaphus truei TaxID=8439 RepID=UPI003F590A64
MKVILCLAFLTCMIFGTQGKTYTRCQLNKIFKDTGLAEYRGHSAAEWICIVEYESSYNTEAINDEGSSRDYGIFQLNSKYWCNDGKTAGSANACQKSCSSFLNDDILDDIECAKKVVSDPKGMSAWVAWGQYCKGKDLSKYTKGC